MDICPPILGPRVRSYATVNAMLSLTLKLPDDRIGQCRVFLMLCSTRKLLSTEDRDQIDRVTILANV